MNGKRSDQRSQMHHARAHTHTSNRVSCEIERCVAVVGLMLLLHILDEIPARKDDGDVPAVRDAHHHHPRAPRVVVFVLFGTARCARMPCLLYL